MMNKAYLTAEYVYYLSQDNPEDIIEYITLCHETLEQAGVDVYSHMPPEIYELDIEVDLENKVETKLELVVDNDKE